MAESEATYVDKFKGYAAKPEVKEIYAAIKLSAIVVDVSNRAVKFLSDPKTTDALAKMTPALAAQLRKVAGCAKVLRHAGVALGVGVDVMVRIGLIEDATMQQLDQISRQIEELRKDVAKAFESLKLQMKIERALHRFLRVHDEMLAKVLRYEQIMASQGDAEKYFKRLGDMVKEFPPSKIIVDLRHMHVLITGEAGFGKPLFEQLAEEGKGLEGEDFDQFLPALLLQFQTVVGLEMRAVRMLRSFITFSEEDTTYSDDVKSIFEYLALQQSEYDPALKYEWYLNFMAFGGQVMMTSVELPGRYVYMTASSKANVEIALRGNPGDHGVFIVKPHPDGGKFLVSTKRRPNWYMYMQNFYSANVRGCEGDPGPQGYWHFSIKDIQARRFTLTTIKWPDWYLSTRGRASGIGNVRGTKGDCSSHNQFELHLV